MKPNRILSEMTKSRRKGRRRMNNVVVLSIVVARKMFEPTAKEKWQVHTSNLLADAWLLWQQ